MTTTPLDRRPITGYLGLGALGIAVGLVDLVADRDRTTSHAGVATANWVHVGLGAFLVLVLAVAHRRDRSRLVGFLRRPLTAGGWAAVTAALRWRGGTPALRPVRFLAAVLMLYVPVRAGEQVLAGLDPDFTRTAWGGPTYLGAAAAHWLDGVLIFLGCALLVGARS